jgi:hypothetical protein
VCKVSAVASLGMKSRVAPLIFVVLALLLASLAICPPTARGRSWGEVVLHAFDSAGGALPDGLVQGRDGNFYGTTAELRAFALINAVESPDIAWSRLERIESARTAVSVTDSGESRAMIHGPS